MSKKTAQAERAVVVIEGAANASPTAEHKVVA
jgi:hypothetical protein